MERIEEFEKAARAISAVCRKARREDLEGEVRAYLQSLGVKKVAADSTLVRLEDFEITEPVDADAGVTDVEWGIASTGTVILPMRSTNRRSTSLLPPIHVALLASERILPDVPAAIAHVGESYMKPTGRLSSVVLVTGPSRTADIELNLVLGVHGPRQLHIILF